MYVIVVEELGSIARIIGPFSSQARAGGHAQNVLGKGVRWSVRKMMAPDA